MNKLEELILYKHFYKSMTRDEIEEEIVADGLRNMDEQELAMYHDNLIARKHLIEELLPPHSERICAHVWKNGAVIETLVYKERQEGEDFYDRIHLMVTDGAGIRRGFLMNDEDAISMIHALEVALKKYREIMYDWSDNGVKQ